MDTQPKITKTSVYLAQRAEALQAALAFFANAGDPYDRLTRFLAQVDFWEWEVDNLIYSFTNFAERAQTWASEHAAMEKLADLGLLFNKKMIQRIRWRHNHWAIAKRQQRIAPIDLLRQTIETWNDLISRCEHTFIEPMRKPAAKFGMQVRKDLIAFRKQMPDLHLNNLAEDEQMQQGE